jgi:hypothetical protein
MSFGFIVANLWGFQNGDLWALVWWLPTYELQKWRLVSFNNKNNRAQFQKPPPYHKRIKEHETNPTMTTVWWNISPTIIHIEYLLRKTKKREIKAMY